MIIDAHTHVYAWPRIAPPKRGDGTTFMSVERQIEFMDGLGIDRAVILPLTNAEAPAEPQSLGEILYICERYPGRFVPYCNIDPRLPLDPDQITTRDFVDLLVQYREAGCLGFGELTARIRWDHPAMRALLGACEEVGFPLIFHSITADVSSYGVIDEIGLPGLESVLRDFPELVVVGHSPGFWSEVSGNLTLPEKTTHAEGPIRPGGAVLRLMRNYPNLHGDLSAGSGFTAISRDTEFGLRFIEEFGERLFFGLDCNKPDCNTGLLEWMNQHHSAHSISDAHFEGVMGGNIARILNISP